MNAKSLESKVLLPGYGVIVVGCILENLALHTNFFLLGSLFGFLWLAVGLFALFFAMRELKKSEGFMLVETGPFAFTRNPAMAAHLLGIMPGLCLLLNTNIGILGIIASAVLFLSTSGLKKWNWKTASVKSIWPTRNGSAASCPAICLASAEIAQGGIESAAFEPPFFGRDRDHSFGWVHPKSAGKFFGQFFRNYILSGQLRLMPLSEDIEAMAQCDAALIATENKQRQERPARDDQEFHEVDVNSLELVRPRSVGVEHAALATLKWLNFEKILEAAGFNHIADCQNCVLTIKHYEV